MKLHRLLFILLFGCSYAVAADLMEVYQQAQASDPIFQQAIAQRMATKEGVPISVASLLPNANLTAYPSLSRYGFSGTNLQEVVSPSGESIYPLHYKQRTYNLNLSITQTVFNVAQFSAVVQQVALSNGADATLNAALQDLMTRVSAAYFAILRDEDTLSYSEAAKFAYAEQLDQNQQQYKVGIKTVTDVYTAEASYNSAVAQYIAAQTALTNDRENLRVMTGVYYPHLSTLSEAFPLVSPAPADADAWVKIAQRQNWSIKSAQYNTTSAKEIIKQQNAGHLPTVSVQGNFTRDYANTFSHYPTFVERNGPGITADQAISLNVNVPIFAGGGVVAQTQQATYNYQISQQQLEQVVRNTMNATRQSYNGVVSGISQIKADQLAIKSNISSLKGLEASYQVGTETLVDVLNQQQKLYQAQTQYATDRYAFINHLLALKKAAGTLSYDDLRAINVWLIDKPRAAIKRRARLAI